MMSKSIALALAAAALLQSRTPATYDIILRHGTVVDGTGAPRFDADVAISGGWIARVGDLSGERGKTELDATGLFVTPGFINIHSHATPDGLVRAENMLLQGVTTEILNADGSGPVDIGDQMSRASDRRLAVNIGTQIGFNSVWSDVMGPTDRRPSPEEIQRMRALIADGLAKGAWGVSAGLDYKPAYFARQEEVIRIVDVARPWRTNFINHDRVTPESGFSSRAGMEETIAIGERAGLAPVITHMKVQGREQGSANLILDAMGDATERGAYTAADAYPYLAGQTGLGALIVPAWAQDGGRDAMLKRFKDAPTRARIVSEAEEAMNARFGGAAGVYLPATKKELTAVMAEMDVSAGEAVVRLLEQGSPGIIARFGIEADLVKILQHPTTSIACDCGAVAREATHPRYNGTFPRVLGRYVREQKALTWEDAIRKMTGLPAATIGLVDSGLLAPGMAADVTVFDPETVIDHATFEEPTLPSEGIRIVLVNGRIAVRDGKVTGEQAGLALVRTKHMPTRPMNTGRRSISRRGRIGKADLVLDLGQDFSAHRAVGTFRLSDPGHRVSIDMRDFGVLQTRGDWASFTGRAKLRGNDDERSITVILDGTTVIVDAAGAYSLTGELKR